jgi:hypothetical protein
VEDRTAASAASRFKLGDFDCCNEYVLFGTHRIPGKRGVNRRGRRAGNGECKRRHVLEHWRDVLEELRQATMAQQQTHIHLVDAAEANQRAGQAMVRAMEAALASKSEYEELGQRVYQLEQLVLELTEDVKRLRDGLAGGNE